MSNLEIALQQMHRVTKKGGFISIDFPNKYCPWFNILKNRFGIGDHINDHFYSVKELRTLLKETGYSDFKARKILFTHYTFNPAFLKLYKFIDFILERTILVKEAAAIIVCRGIK